ncbi:MAG: hypothetical protein ACRD5D_09730, partial [Candidatus Polarisedimenticolia bacterium]
PPETAPNLLQLIARADLVARVRVVEGALKHAIVEVLEAVKGTPPAPRLRIAFRDWNFDRPAGIDPIVFADGEESILLLKPASARRKGKDGDLFDLLEGPRGRLPIPPEGAAPVVDAARDLTAVAIADPSTQRRLLSERLRSVNPFLLLAVLAELDRLGGAAPDDLPALLALVRSPRSPVRAGALVLLGRLFRTGASGVEVRAGASSGDPFPDQLRAALAAVIESARNDPEVPVRVAAVAAMGKWPTGSDTTQELRAIAGADPDQAVRYEAERILFKMKYGDSMK